MSGIGFLFPGQGAQFVGMGRELVESVPVAADLFAEANEVLGYDLAKICFEGPEEQLNATEFCQPALVACSMAALASLRSDSPEVIESCEMAAGLSLGEYSALCFAEVMSFSDALQVVQRRGQAMQSAADANPSRMVAVLGLESKQVDELCDRARLDGEVLQIANLLCPGNIVCSGNSASCQRLIEVAEEAGAMKALPLTVAGAFHTSLMQSAVAQLAEALAGVPMKAPRVPVVSNVDARPHTDPEEIRQLLIQQVVNPVQWEQSIGTMVAAGVGEFYEVGAGKVLRGLMKRINRKIPIHNV